MPYFLVNAADTLTRGRGVFGSAGKTLRHAHPTLSNLTGYLQLGVRYIAILSDDMAEIARQALDSFGIGGRVVVPNRSGRCREGYEWSSRWGFQPSILEGKGKGLYA